MNEEELTILSLFISSSGDVGQERLISEEVDQRLDAELGNEVVLKSYFWEYEPIVISEDFQVQIPPLSIFDIVICILWSRLGSRLHSRYNLPPAFVKVADSGTEYEFVDAVLANREKGTPDILVWQNLTELNVPAEAADRDERLRNWDLLLAFIKEWTRDEEEQTLKGGINSYRIDGSD